MLKLKSEDAIGILNELSELLNTTPERGYGTSILEIPINQGTGSITAYEVFAGLEGILVELSLLEPIHLELSQSKSNTVNFFFCTKGNFYHGFTTDKTEIHIRELQNVITSDGNEAREILHLPAKTAIQLSWIRVTHKNLLINALSEGLYIRKILADFCEETLKNHPYRYVGGIGLKAVDCANRLFQSHPHLASDRLLREASVYSLLGTQISGHIEELNKPFEDSPLSAEETKKVYDLSHHIETHISQKINISDLRKISGLNEKKLQKGFQYLYGMSITSFISNTRLEIAREELEKSSKSISEIVYAVGISSRSYFSKMFLQRFGLSPTQYRQEASKPQTQYEITYRSEARPNITPTEINDILKTAQRVNEKKNITGCLIFYDGYFFQILEGPRTHVEEVMEKISTDIRHFQVQILWEGYKSVRAFHDWSMAFLREEDLKLVRQDKAVRSLNDRASLAKDIANKLITNEFWSKIRRILLTG